MPASIRLHPVRLHLPHSLAERPRPFACRCDAKQFCAAAETTHCVRTELLTDNLRNRTAYPQCGDVVGALALARATDGVVQLSRRIDAIAVMVVNVFVADALRSQDTDPHLRDRSAVR